MSQTLQLQTSCDVHGCLGLSTQMLDRNGPMPWGLPDGWFQIVKSGAIVMAICPRHKVDSVWYIDGKVIDV